MLFVVGKDDVGFIILANPVEQRRFAHLCTASGAVAVDILPCLRVRECEKVRGDSHDRAILVMKVPEPVGLFAPYVVNKPRKFRGTTEERSGKMAKRMEEDIVYDCSKVVENELKAVSQEDLGLLCIPYVPESPRVRDTKSLQAGLYIFGSMGPTTPCWSCFWFWFGL